MKNYMSKNRHINLIHVARYCRYWLLVPFLSLLVSCGNGAVDSGASSSIVSGKAFTGVGIANTDALVTDANGNLV